ncbi:MAG: Tm-1-like ATP-binding domain-containing protein [Pseudomonadota bacterium]
MARALVIGTVETKGAAIGALVHALELAGLSVKVLDISLKCAGNALSAEDKLARIEQRGAAAATEIAAQIDDFQIAIGIGGGTGGEIALGALKGLPASYPKMLITTMAFDPRAALADSSITLVPTLCDIEGINAMLAQVLANSAAMAAALVKAPKIMPSNRPAIAMTTLGATGAAGAQIAEALDARGFEATVFHANGFGGAALSQFIREGRAIGLIDLNVHELGRMRLAGAHAPMPGRFTSGADIPRVVLPGALNFLGLGSIDTINPAHLARPHYRHSGHFTHVKLTKSEMAEQSLALAAFLNTSRAPCRVLIPMGGFSNEDRPGGMIEDESLRQIAASTLEGAAESYTVTRLPHHINAPETALAAVDAMTETLDAGVHQDA